MADTKRKEYCKDSNLTASHFMNIFLCTLSAINPQNISEYHYRHDNGADEIIGYFSGEAPARYLIRELYKARYALFDKYIVLSMTVFKHKGKNSLRIIRLDEIKPEEIPDDFPLLREHYSDIQYKQYDPFNSGNTRQRILAGLLELANDCIIRDNNNS